jgi:hypothetical protein
LASATAFCGPPSTGGVSDDLPSITDAFFAGGV